MSDEQVVIVDETDELLGIMSKQEAHQQKLYHRQVYVLLINPKGEMLLQKRSPNKAFDPNKWTTSVSGHVNVADSSYLEAARRELLEELDIAADSLEYIGNVIAASRTSEELCGGPSAVYVLKADLPITAIKGQTDEISNVGYFPLDQIRMATTGEGNLIMEREVIKFSEDFQVVLDLYWRSLNPSG